MCNCVVYDKFHFEPGTPAMFVSAITTFYRNRSNRKFIVIVEFDNGHRLRGYVRMLKTAFCKKLILIGERAKVPLRGGVVLDGSVVSMAFSFSPDVLIYDRSKINPPEKSINLHGLTAEEAVKFMRGKHL